MRFRRAFTTAALVGLFAVPAQAAASALDYWQYYGSYPTEEQCHSAAAENYPWDADDYACVTKNGAWDLYFIYPT